jgi:predicted O-linked N-acetylglucosamine transferase (SPINDLY family)
MSTPHEPVTVSQAIAIALEHHRAGRLGDAENIYRQVLAVDVDNFDALHLLGVAGIQSGRPTDGIRYISRALAQQPANAEAHNNLGEAYRAQGDLAHAVVAFEQAIALRPEYFEAHNNLGNVRKALERTDEAAACYRRALALNPNYPEAHVNLGNVLQERGEWDDAIEQYELALELRPGFATALNNLGNVYRAQRKLEEALPYFEQAVAVDPRYAQAHVNLGHVLLASGARGEARTSFETALSIDPENPEARWALAFSQLALVHASDESQESFRTAFSSALRELDQWFNETRLDRAADAVGTLQPFYLAYHEENNQPLLAQYGALCDRIMARWQRNRNIGTVARRRRSNPVHLAIVSAQIYDQSVWNAIVKGWCTRLDPERVRISVFHLGATCDQETAVARSQSRRFVYGPRSLSAWAREIVAAEPDVIAYPEIGMDPMTLQLACLRLAPRQIAAWGHPETTGLPTIDHYLSSERFEPDEADQYYTERLVRLPNLGTFYSALDVPPYDLDLEELGVDTGVPLLICPGAPFKYLPQHDHVFVEIARKARECQFVFFEYTRQDLHRQLSDRLQGVFENAGLEFDRFVVFIPWLKRPAFYALLRSADVYLDTIGFSGFNTAIQAVECGLPIVTRRGRFMRGRFGAGILDQLGLTELAAATTEEYVDTATRLAFESGYRSDVRRSIEASRIQLFDDVMPIRALEDFLDGAREDRG